ncbi:MAG: carboxypeptidase regulatory-like domain-containing protein [Myxococcales bacterium]|nr:carboxypeptidase regulatory-like domain-containing protein [Myxococcales bacterium]
MRGHFLILGASLGIALGAALSLNACTSGGGGTVGQGGECDYLADPEDPEARVCADGLTCDPVAGADTFVCGPPVIVRGQIFDALNGLPVPDAYVTALDQASAPSSDVAVTDATGHYELLVSAFRKEDGELLGDAIYTLQAFAADYQPFPYGVRPALPLNTDDAIVESGVYVVDGREFDAELNVIDNPTTSVALIPLPAAKQGGGTIFGNVGGRFPGGTLVVAEGGEQPAPYGVADLSGDYVIFNVQPGAVTVKGYRRGLELETASVSIGAETLTGVDLLDVAEGDQHLGTVAGSANIVNAPGGSVTSVVLVPSSVFNEVFELGPVPFGLRVPDPGLAPDVSGAFRFEGVPEGTFKVLAAFENDDLVRDPDTNISGTQIQEVTLGRGGAVEVDENFKVTEALAVVSPGADAPEEVSGAPTLVWADDSSEDGYELVVYNALGELVWDDLNVPGVSGSATVEVEYGGPALIPGMYYQFRAKSIKKDSAISRTEDLRGVFVAR